MHFNYWNTMLSSISFEFLLYNFPSAQPFWQHRVHIIHSTSRFCACALYNVKCCTQHRRIGHLSSMKYTIRSIVSEASCHPVTWVIWVICVRHSGHSGHLGHLGHSSDTSHWGHSGHLGHLVKSVNIEHCNGWTDGLTD